ncbi:MAG: hypothetical protein R6X25_15040 [Candidatus Krumholzibacteriia bacterium]
MLDLSRLNDHSHEFARRLFREFPEWCRFARFDPYEEFEKEALLVEVPRPAEGGMHGLFVTTSEWEVSVGFGESFHARFGASGDGHENFLDDAMNFIRDLVAERVAVAVARQGDEWLGAWKLNPANHDLDTAEREDGVVISIRSWRGTHDRDIT